MSYLVCSSLQIKKHLEQPDLSKKTKVKYSIKWTMC